MFPDDVSGGGDFINRPGMVALLAFLDAKPETSYVVIFDDLKRFARDTVFHLKLRGELGARQARPECLNFKFEDTPEGEFIETILAAQGQLERKRNRRQVIQKMQARVKAGYWAFSPPIGYRYANVPGHGKMLVRDEPNASIIAEALEGFASGRFGTVAEVSRFMNRQPTMPRNKWGEVSVKYAGEILDRELYSGFFSVKKWGWTRIQGQHEPLISYETYRKIQNRLHDGPTVAVRNDVSAEFPLRGFIACAECGKAMTAAFAKGRNKPYGYYDCFQRGCGSYRKSIRREKLESDFMALLRSVTPTKALFDVAYAMFRDLWDARLTQAGEAAKAAKSEVRKIDDEIAGLLDRIVKTENPRVVSAYEDKIDTLEADKLVWLEKAQKRASKARGANNTFEEKFEPAMRFLSNPWKLWENGRLQDRQTILKLVFARPLAYAPDEGFSNRDLSMPFKVLQDFSASRGAMVVVPDHPENVSLFQGKTGKCCNFSFLLRNRMSGAK